MIVWLESALDAGDTILVITIMCGGEDQLAGWE